MDVSGNFLKSRLMSVWPSESMYHDNAVVVVGMVAGGLQIGSSAGSEDVRAVGRALDLHRGEEPTIVTRRLVLILLEDAERLMACS